jgi:fluoroquinolone resistance protein
MTTPIDPWAGRDVFEDETFSGIELADADLAGREFIRCRFEKLVLQESNWHGARLDDCEFDGCDLTRMRPKKMAARGVVFTRCRLMGVDWSELNANPSFVFEDCNLQYASFVEVNLTATPFRRCRLVETNFFDTRLVEAVFQECDLAAARFEDCDLRQADFADSRGVIVDPSKNTVTGCRVSVETAVAVAAGLGLRVAGTTSDVEDKPRGKKRR